MAALTLQAELLAAEIESGRLSDRGGADALRLLAAIVRVTGMDAQASTRTPPDTNGLNP